MQPIDPQAVIAREQHAPGTMTFAVEIAAARQLAVGQAIDAAAATGRPATMSSDQINLRMAAENSATSARAKRLREPANASGQNEKLPRRQQTKVR